MPPRLPNAHTRIAFHKVPVGGDGHVADDFPLAGVVIEAPEGAFLPWAGFDAGDGVGEVREADGGWAVEVGGTVGLHGDDEGEIQAGRQGRGQAAAGTGAMPILPPRVPSSLKTALAGTSTVVPARAGFSVSTCCGKATVVACVWLVGWRVPAQKQGR